MKEQEFIIPPLFRCPISLDLFSDPVTLCTGQTYDRANIEKWLACGNLTCPVTMQKLHDPSIVPNHTLRHLINQWLQEGIQCDPNYLKIIDHTGSFADLKRVLESDDESTLGQKIHALQSIYFLAQELPLNNSVLIQLDFFPLLLELVFRSSACADNLLFAENALLCALKLLPFSDLASLDMLKEEPTFANFVNLMQQGSTVVKKCLCQVIEAVSSASSADTRQLLSTFGKAKGLIQEMVHLADQNSEATEAGTRAISALCSLESNRESLVREGAIDGLLSYLLNAEKHERNLAPLAMATIEKLVAVKGAEGHVMNHPKGISAIVKMVFRVSDHEGSENAVNALMIICQDSIIAREESISAGLLTQLLLLLQSQCSVRIKTKARLLLKLLRSMWVQDPKNPI